MFCNKPKPWDSVEENVVVYHQFIKGKTCPSQSPFNIKLECYLRLANIRYETDYSKTFGPKGKSPWITLNKKDMGDSQFIIEHLNEKFKVDIDSGLDPERKGALEAARCMVDYHLFWVYVLWRFYHSKAANFLRTGGPDSKFQKFIFRYVVPLVIKSRSNSQGMGSHTEAEQFSLAIKCMESLSGLLGDRKFFGGENPCSADCSIFGMLAQFYWTEPENKYEKLLKEDYPSLGRYCLAMKERIYPDWDSLLKT